MAKKPKQPPEDWKQQAEMWKQQFEKAQDKLNRIKKLSWVDALKGKLKSILNE